MRLRTVLGMLVAAGILAVSLGSADARNARNICPWPKEVVRSVEVCHGAKLPRTNTEFLAALKACGTDDDCVNAAVIKRDQMRDPVRDAYLRQKVEKDTLLELGRQVFPAIAGTLDGIKREGRIGATPLADSGALERAIGDIKSAGENYSKAIGSTPPPQ